MTQEEPNLRRAPILKQGKKTLTPIQDTGEPLVHLDSYTKATKQEAAPQELNSQPFSHLRWTQRDERREYQHLQQKYEESAAIAALYQLNEKETQGKAANLADIQKGSFLDGSCNLVDLSGSASNYFWNSPSAFQLLKSSCPIANPIDLNGSFFGIPSAQSSKKEQKTLVSMIDSLNSHSLGYNKSNMQKSRLLNEPEDSDDEPLDALMRREAKGTLIALDKKPKLRNLIHSQKQSKPNTQSPSLDVGPIIHHVQGKPIPPSTALQFPQQEEK